MPALDALFLKNIFASDLGSGSFMESFLGALVRTTNGEEKFHPVELRDMRRKGLAVPFPSPGTFAKGETGATLRQSLARYTEASYAYYVSEKMMPLVTAASESMPEEVLVPQDLPSEYGFMVIPGGIATIDVRGAMLKYNAILWATYGGKVYVYWLTDKYDMQDTSNSTLRMTIDDAQWTGMPRLTVSHVSNFEFGKPLPTTFGPNMVLPPEVSQGIHFNWDEESGSVSIAIENKGYSPEELAELFQQGERTDPASRWLLTVWRLMQQTVTNVTEEQAPRGLKKQMERKNLDTKVSVIGLRHQTVRGEGGSEVEWSHRWLVKGHWRNQKVKDGHRLVWIHPYVKGPDDKPLLVREHVYALVR